MVKGISAVASLCEYIRTFRFTSELGLTVVRSRSRENNTQLFSNTLAPLRYTLYGSNVNPYSRAKLSSEVRLGGVSLCEYTHALRLTSKLADLRAGYVNPYSRRNGRAYKG